MDAMKIDRAHISGESLGGWVAARFALSHPDRLDRLVLNTTGGSAARPEVMARIKELSQRAADDPSWDFIKARLDVQRCSPRLPARRRHLPPRAMTSSGLAFLRAFTRLACMQMLELGPSHAWRI
jgi:pimeloyl-ACP methyl ester carboxylesterase